MVGLSAAIWSEAEHEEDFLNLRALEKKRIQIKNGCAWEIQRQDLLLHLLSPAAEVRAQPMLIKMQVVPTKLIHKGYCPLDTTEKVPCCGETLNTPSAQLVINISRLTVLYSNKHTEELVSACFRKKYNLEQKCLCIHLEYKSSTGHGLHYGNYSQFLVSCV